jgi:glycosyltransferase involved in cell wall biosynthesis
MNRVVNPLMTSTDSPDSTSAPPLGLSVVVTAWNRREFLAEAIGSVTSSPRTRVEIVVVANFRHDRLEEKVRVLGGFWVESNEERQGAMTADGVRAANGEVVAFLDDDDLCLPGRLDTVCRVFANDPELGFYHHGQRTFRDREALVMLPGPSPERLRIPANHRSVRACEQAWTLGAGYNGSSTAVRRSVLTPHLPELERIRKSVPPYLFYRAWDSSTSLLVDTQPLAAVRLHGRNTTPNPSLDARSRLVRLARISGDLGADATTILSFLPPETWTVPLGQMRSMETILKAVDDPTTPRHPVASAALDLLRRRRIWLPRHALVGLAMTRLVSPRTARAFGRYLKTSDRSAPFR